MLELELTESALARDGEQASEILLDLRKLGVKLAIDDFGTGYSSLAHLKHFPLDALKIDRSFVQGLPDGQDDIAIASAIIGMGRSLGLEVVAEGVETTEQLAALRQLGCNIYQGYLCSKPVSADEFAQLLEHTAVHAAAT